MFTKHSIYGFSPEQNMFFQDFNDNIEFEKASTGSDPLNSQESVRVIAEDLYKSLNHEEPPISSEASLITIGLTYKMLTANKPLSDELVKSFEIAIKKDPLISYAERKKHIEVMESQIQGQ